MARDKRNLTKNLSFRAHAAAYEAMRAVMAATGETYGEFLRKAMIFRINHIADELDSEAETESNPTLRTLKRAQAAYIRQELEPIDVPDEESVR